MSRAKREKDPLDEVPGAKDLPRLSDLFASNDGLGRIDLEGGAQMREMVKAVVENGQKATLTLTLTISQESANALQITPKLTCKAPAPKPRPAIRFPTEDGDLLEEEPIKNHRQGVLFQAADAHKAS